MFTLANKLDANPKNPVTTGPQQAMYLEKFGDLLNIIDDDKKRAAFLKDLNKKTYAETFSFQRLKNIALYLIKLCVIVFAYFVIKFLGMRILNYQMKVISNKRALKHSKNVKGEDNYLLFETLASLFKSIFIWFLRVVFTLLFLIVMGVSIGPLVYGVSFIGFGVTLASQNIIKDFINGILIIMDGSMAVGEVIQVAGYRGRVEHITLRSLSLRNKLGDLVIIPFSNINEVLNYSRNYARLRTEVIIAHYQEIEVVKKAFEEAGERFAVDFADKIKEKFSFLGVTEFSDHGTHVAATVTTKPDPSFALRRTFALYVHDAMLNNEVARVDGKYFKD